MGKRYDIISQGGRWRGLLPVYSADQALGSFVVVGGLFVLAWLLHPEAALGVTAAGGAGGLAVAYYARPAYLVIGRERVPLIIEALQLIAYRYVPERDHWAPPIPRWMRWSYNVVKIKEAGSEVRIEGPANLLHLLAAKV